MNGDIIIVVIDQNKKYEVDPDSVLGKIIQ